MSTNDCTAENLIGLVKDKIADLRESYRADCVQKQTEAETKIQIKDEEITRLTDEKEAFEALLKQKTAESLNLVEEHKREVAVLTEKYRKGVEAAKLAATKKAQEIADKAEKQKCEALKGFIATIDTNTFPWDVDTSGAGDGDGNVTMELEYDKLPEQKREELERLLRTDVPMTSADIAAVNRLLPAASGNIPLIRSTIVRYKQTERGKRQRVKAKSSTGKK